MDAALQALTLTSADRLEQEPASIASGRIAFIPNRGTQAPAEVFGEKSTLYCIHSYGDTASFGYCRWICARRAIRACAPREKSVHRQGEFDVMGGGGRAGRDRPFDIEGVSARRCAGGSGAVRVRAASAGGH